MALRARCRARPTGNGRLNGDRGHNLLNGGGGADRHIFRTLAGDSHVVGFTHGVDKLVLARRRVHVARPRHLRRGDRRLRFDLDGAGGAAPAVRHRTSSGASPRSLPSPSATSCSRRAGRRHFGPPGTHRPTQTTPPPAEPKCGARTRRATASQCKALANGRCRLHGGYVSAGHRRRGTEGTPYGEPAALRCPAARAGGGDSAMARAMCAAQRRRETDPYTVIASYYPDHQLLTTDPA